MGPRGRYAPLRLAREQLLAPAPHDEQAPRLMRSSRSQGRLAVVTDDDARALAIAGGSEREPVVGRRDRISSKASASGSAARALAPLPMQASSA
jgi:hypothetical protein